MAKKCSAPSAAPSADGFEDGLAALAAMSHEHLVASCVGLDCALATRERGVRRALDNLIAHERSLAAAGGAFSDHVAARHAYAVSVLEELRGLLPPSWPGLVALDDDAEVDLDGS